jgi:hypothetical protein
VEGTCIQVESCILHMSRFLTILRSLLAENCLPVADLRTCQNLVWHKPCCPPESTGKGTETSTGKGMDEASEAYKYLLARFLLPSGKLCSNLFTNLTVSKCYMYLTRWKICAVSTQVNCFHHLGAPASGALVQFPCAARYG